MTQNGLTRDDLLARVGALPLHDLPPDRAERVAVALKARLAHRRGRPAILGRLRRLEMPAVALLSFVYLAWAVTRALLVFGVVRGG